MHILYITQYFPPESGAAQNRAYEMARNLVELGNQVTVLTGFPNYPEGVIHDDYKGKIYQKEEIDGITVIRNLLIPDTKENRFARILNYLSFLVSSIIGGLFVSDVDIVYATTPPISSVGLSGYILSKVNNARFSLELRDLWVDMAIYLDKLNNEFFIKLLRKYEHFLYKKAWKIVTVTNGFKDELIDRNIDGNKIDVITNGVDYEFFKPKPKRNWVREEYGMENKFVVMYAGNIGIPQNLEFVLEAAKKNKDHEDILFVFVGTGVEKQQLKKRKNKENLTNVKFIPNQPKKKIPDFLSAADILLISLKDIPLFRITIPSKVFDYMAMERPILVGVEGEASDIIENANAGKFFKPCNSNDLLEKLMDLYNNKEQTNKLGKNARQYAINKFSRFELSKKLYKSFKSELREKVNL